MRKLLVVLLVLVSCSLLLGNVIRLELWYAQTGLYSQAIIDICEDFNRLNEGRIHVTPVYSGNYDDTMVKLLMGLVSGDLPHFAQVEQSRVGQLVDGGAIQILEPLIDNDPEFKAQMDDFFPRLLNNTVYYGQLHGFPLNNSTPILYYNKDLYERAGLDPDKPPATWDELVYNARKISALGPEVFGFRVDSADWLLEMYIWQAGGEVISEDGRTILFGSPEAISAAEFFQDLIREGTAVMTITGGGDLDMTGNIGQMIRSTGSLGHLIANAPFDFGATTIPPKVRGDVPIGGGNLYMIGGHSEEEIQAAWELMKFFVTPENSLRYALDTGYMTSRISAFNAPEIQELMEADPRFRNTYTHLETVARRRPFHGPYREAWSLLAEAWQKVLTDMNADAEAEYERAARLAQRVLDEYWEDFDF